MTDEEKSLRFQKEALIHLQALDCFARRLTKGGQEADDLVQECLEKAWRNFHQYRSGTQCKSWLFTILANSYRMRLRLAHRRREVCWDPVRELDRFLCRSLRVSAEESYWKATVGPVTQQLITGLTKHQRHILVMSDLMELTYREISDLLGIPVGTVRSRLSRARLAIRMGWKERAPSLIPCAQC